MILVLVGIHVPGDQQLPGVVHALDGLASDFCLGKSGQQHRRQDRNDGNDDEQFDQGKSAIEKPALTVAGSIAAFRTKRIPRHGREVALSC